MTITVGNNGGDAGKAPPETADQQRVNIQLKQQGKQSVKQRSNRHYINLE